MEVEFSETLIRQWLAEGDYDRLSLRDSKTGGTVLHFAATRPMRADLLLTLLKIPSKVWKVRMFNANNDGKTPLHVAVHAKNENAVLLMVQAEPMIAMVSDPEGLTPYFLASTLDFSSITKLLQLTLVAANSKFEAKELKRKSLRLQGKVYNLEIGLQSVAECIEKLKAQLQQEICEDLNEFEATEKSLIVAHNFYKQKQCEIAATKEKIKKNRKKRANMTAKYHLAMEKINTWVAPTPTPTPTPSPRT